MKQSKRHHFGFSFQNMQNKDTFTLEGAEKQVSQWFGKKSMLTSLQFTQSQNKH